MKTLTTEQIQALHSFVRKHYVEYYDIEVELVDHLANGIESQWAEDNTVDFEIALDREFKKFGVYGFSDVVNHKEKSLYNHYTTLIFKEVLHFLHWPKIILTAGLYYALYLMIDYLSLSFDRRDVVSSFMIGTILLSLVYLIVEVIKVKRLNKLSSKKWLMDRARLSILTIPITGFYVFYYVISFVSRYSIILATASILTTVLWLYITHFVISPQLKIEKESIKSKLLTI